ncbi:MAG: ThiJ/PfpI domain-containing protein [bacterium]|nr:MAG: ThiJ/PfpI domain-containing protein [bacterium]
MQIGFILFPNVTQLDFTGPLQMLHRVPGATTHILARTRAPVPSDCGLGLVPTVTFAEAPELDMICVPGGFGVGAAIQDAETLDFVRKAGRSARYVTSVCTGAFVLGAAGLLRGRRATTHWAYHHLLPLVGAIPQQGRVVRDENVFTGGGVTAGIDFALTVAAEIASPEAAQRIQLATEYDPDPPFAAGSPDRAPVEVSGGLKAFFAARTAEFEQELAAALAAA